jgi:anti-sigma B factor antagonist
MRKDSTLLVALDILGDVLVIRPQGRFDAYQVPTFNQWLEEQQIEARHMKVVINLESVQFIDTMALSTLVHWLKRTREYGGDLRLCCLQPAVQLIFEISRIKLIFAIYPSEEDAIAAFRT